MKRIFLLSFVVFSFFACRKESTPVEPDPHQIITGNVSDMETGAPVAGTGVYIYQKFWVGPLNDNGYWSYKTLDSATTDANGAFSVEHYSNSYGQLAVNYLRVVRNSLPAGYQQTVRVNDDYDCLFYEEGVVLNETHYAIRLMPRTWFRFQLPAIPAAWAEDTLFLRASNICRDNACGCFPQKDFAIAFQHPGEVQDFQQQVWETAYGNMVTLDYKVKGKNIEFANYFQTECPWRDTTTVLITF